MSYRINFQADIQTDVIRIISEQIHHTYQKINDPDMNFDDKVHDARKHLKKIRALLRLIRYDIGKANYRSENTFYRDIGRKMSDMREARVNISTMATIEKEYTDEDNKIFMFLVKKRLDQHYENLKQQFISNQVFDQVTEKMEEGKQRLPNLHLTNNDFKVFRGGVKKVYKDGQSSLDMAQHEPIPENVHEWRKQVKYLWYQVRLIRSLWKPVLKGYEKSLDKLSDYLGDEHDFSVLRQWINDQLGVEMKDDIKKFNKYIEKKRQKLQQKAWPVGEMIYSDSPKAFVQRLEQCWQAKEEFA